MVLSEKTGEETELLEECNTQWHVFVVNGSGVNTQSTPAE